VHPLDLWINGEADCAARLTAAAEVADLVIVEGVMGLYDGAPSAADLARRFALPVLAVIDAGAMAETFGAVVQGLRTWKPGLPWAGVLANRVGGVRHAAMLEHALDADPRWLGHLPHDAAFALPERHLGLAAAAELPGALARLDALADALATTPLGRRALAEWPHWTPPEVQPVATPVRHLAGRTIAYARDAAFGFVYDANLDVLQSLGARIVSFSPLAGDPLPACDAVWLPGGYPELHAARLAARTDLRAQLAAHVAGGRPLWAECGGLMTLADVLVDADGIAHRIVGSPARHGDGGRPAGGARTAAAPPGWYDAARAQLPLVAARDVARTLRAGRAGADGRPRYCDERGRGAVRAGPAPRELLPRVVCLVTGTGRAAPLPGALADVMIGVNRGLAGCPTPQRAHVRRRTQRRGIPRDCGREPLSFSNARAA
jgi:cobyrinic acid a,c-diamide synthase